jgi:preprotein translocase subunit SecG
MFSIVLFLNMIVCILLMIVVLMQSSKGGGLAGSFGGGTMGTVFGVRRTADFLSRTTTILAAVFIGLCLLANLAFLPASKSARESIIQGGSPTSVPAPLPPRNQSAPISGEQPQ